MLNTPIAEGIKGFKAHTKSTIYTPMVVAVKEVFDILSSTPGLAV
jgi:hypothetical protein